MIKTDNELKEILNVLLKNNENECVEFKSAKNDYDVDKLGKYFSAISNEATLRNKQFGWIIFGVDDKTHKLTNTKFYSDNNFKGFFKNKSYNFLISIWSYN